MKIRKIAAQLIGWIFMVVGIAGLFLPIIPGVVFLFLSLMILSAHYHWAHMIFVNAHKRFPHVSEHVDAFLNKMQKRFPTFHRHLQHHKSRLVSESSAPTPDSD